MGRAMKHEFIGIVQIPAPVRPALNTNVPQVIGGPALMAHPDAANVPSPGPVLPARPPKPGVMSHLGQIPADNTTIPTNVIITKKKSRGLRDFLLVFQETAQFACARRVL